MSHTLHGFTQVQNASQTTDYRLLVERHQHIRHLLLERRDPYKSTTHIHQPQPITSSPQHHMVKGGDSTNPEFS